MDAAPAIRFQAGAQDAGQSFGLDHRKNYAAVSLAVHRDSDTRDLLVAHVIGAVNDALAGARFLNLVDTSRDSTALTPLCWEVVRFALQTAMLTPSRDGSRAGSRLASGSSRLRPNGASSSAVLSSSI